MHDLKETPAPVRTYMYKYTYVCIHYVKLVYRFAVASRHFSRFYFCSISMKREKKDCFLRGFFHPFVSLFIVVIFLLHFVLFTKCTAVALNGRKSSHRKTRCGIKRRNCMLLSGRCGDSPATPSPQYVPNMFVYCPCKRSATAFVSMFHCSFDTEIPPLTECIIMVSWWI